MKDHLSNLQHIRSLCDIMEPFVYHIKHLYFMLCKYN